MRILQGNVIVNVYMCLRRKRDRESQRDIIRMLDLPWLHLLVMYNKLSLSMNKVGLLNVDCIALDKFVVQLQTSRNTKQGTPDSGGPDSSSRVSPTQEWNGKPVVET